jgi:hypothetical protein
MEEIAGGDQQNPLFFIFDMEVHSRHLCPWLGVMTRGRTDRDSLNSALD